jgi:hypothetical protein
MQMADEEKKGGALAQFMGGGALSVGKKEMAAALMESANDGSTGGGDVSYLSFSGQGANYTGWRLGRDKVKPDPDAIYIVDPNSAVEGHVCWKANQVVEKHEWSVYSRRQNEIPVSQLADHGPFADGDGWKLMRGISMFDVDAPDQQIKFTTTTTSAKNSLSDLTKEIAKRLVNDEPYVPVIRLADSKFTSNGKPNGKPEFPVEGWVTEEEVFVYLKMGDDGDLDDLLSGVYAEGEGAEEAAAEPAPVEPPRGGRRKRRAAA